MNLFIVNMKLLVVPPDISRNALFTIIPCIFIGVYIAIVTNHNTLCVVYCLLFITSVLYWTNTSWETMMYIDIAVAIILIITMSCIVTTRFTCTCNYLWFIALCIMGISFIVNRTILMRRVYSFDTIERSIIGDVIDTYYPITYTQDGTYERMNAYQTSSQMHMIMIHLLPTIIFATGMYISCNNDVV